LYAYALGYLTHYVTDVVAHPYVNQVVEGPFRLHWQRHHLVEFFIDAYVWDRWHVLRPGPGGAEERPLDAPTFAPNVMGTGAPILTARLHDHITVGSSSLGDPVDKIIKDVCSKIEQGLFDIGVLENTDMDAPDDATFKEWCGLMVKTIRDVYTGTQQTPIRHPTILDGPPDPRPGGFPREEDLAGAYGVLRLILKISTEENIKPPVFPDITSDITSVIAQTMEKVTNDIGGIPPFPTPNTSGSFSFDALIQAIADIAQWAAEAAEGIAKAVVDLLQGIAGAGKVLVTDSIKIVLWLLDSALYAMYRYFRQVLVLNAYTSPFQEELLAQIGIVSAADLWVSKGNIPKMGYPAEENPKARDLIGNTYRPYIPPTDAKIVEMPPVQFIAPYGQGSQPEAFLEAQVGKDNMFAISALQTPILAPTAQQEKTFTDIAKDFGGAISNSAIAIQTFERIGADLVLPNFDMDADRGYAWPGWQVDPDPNPLDPTKPGNLTGVHVNAVNTID
jgi:hypothetical protein